MRFWGRGRALAATVVVALGLGALGNALAQKQTTKKAGAHRINELTLAGLRPGVHFKGRAVQLYGRPAAGNQDAQLSWVGPCHILGLTMDIDAAGKIQVIRVAYVKSTEAVDCESLPSPWKTGHGLRLGDASAKVAAVYGEPDSRSPSTTDGQPLELWYYAFDWAGADVPQVMEVLCTKEKEGQPGRVVEITLAAPSL